MMSWSKWPFLRGVTLAKSLWICRIGLLAIALTLLTSCSLISSPPRASLPTTIAPPPPDALTLKRPKVVVIDGHVCQGPDSYKASAYNWSAVRRYISQSNAERSYYKIQCSN